MPTNIDLSVADRVARVTFQTPSGVHVFSTATKQRLGEVMTELEGRSDVRVVVFQADGRTFIAGADIHELNALTPETAHSLAREGQELMQRIHRLPAVSLAAMHAACAGGGCELALACDLRMASAGAKIGLPETSLGLLPGWGGTVRCVRLFGGAAARRMILVGDLLAADEALRLGVVDSVSTDDAFRGAVESRVKGLLARGPAALGQVKGLVRRFEGPGVEEELAAEAAAFAECFRTPEPAEGTAAFLEKRPPRW